MADNEIELKIVTKADTTEAEALEDVIEEVKTSASDEISMESNAEEVSTEFEDLADSAGTAKESIDSANDSTSNLDSSNVNNASSDFDDLTNSASDANTELENLQSSMDMIEAGALMSISHELSSLGSEAEGAAQDMNNTAISLGQLATNANMAEGDMTNLIANISNVTFPKEEAISYVNMLNQMGVASDKLGESATNIDKINDATGMGSTKAMQLVRGFGALGVQGDNLASTFNAVAYAEANSIDGAGELGTVLKRQAGVLNEYNIDVDTATVAISQLSHQYGSSMKAGSALSKALKDNNGDLKAVEQQLGLTAGSLENASSITGQYQGKLEDLAAEEMEHKTVIERLGAAYDDLTMYLSPVLSPLSSFMGIIGQAGSFAVGVNGLNTLWQSMQKLSIVQSITGRFSGLKTAVMGAGGAAKSAVLNYASLSKELLVNAVNAARNAATSFATLAKEVLTAGYNALKSAAMWLVQKAQLIATTVADYAAAAAQWALNIAMDANPIMLVVLAITALIAVLGYLYFNNEQVRQAVDWLGQSFVNLGQTIYNAVLGFVSWVQLQLTNLYNYIMTFGGLLDSNVSITGNNIVDSILMTLAFVATLPFQIAKYLTDVIAEVLGFGPNFTSNLIQSAVDAVNGFLDKIKSLPDALLGELNRMIQHALDFASHFPEIIWEAAVNAVTGFGDGSGIHSPGFMARMLEGEMERLESLPVSFAPRISKNTEALGSKMVNAFSSTNLDGLEVSNSVLTGSSNKNDDFNAANNGINVTFEGCTFDKKERVQEVLDILNNYFLWNNATAGRTR